jgi:uncharacterized protein with NRDE domain
MCLVAVALGVAPRHTLLVAANRDERHARAAQRASWWRDVSGIFAGRDLEAGGTWFGVDRRGRLAAVTNVRDDPPNPGPRSRGALPIEFLSGAESAADYAARVTAAGVAFSPFNLLLFDGAELRYASNRAAPLALGPGVHAFSNAPHGTEWPKTTSARAGLERLLDAREPIEPLFALLAERGGEKMPPEHRYRSAHFIAGAVYGTRCSTVIALDVDGTLTFVERSFDAAGERVAESRATFAITAPSTWR